ncbi:putative sodium/proton nucleoside transporter [Escherichia coli]|nr:putative sodium/proton nucleoside transporter [Escherichia coli]
MDIMRSIVGMAVLLIIAFLLSVNKKRISLRTTGAALVLQIAIGGIMLYFPRGNGWLNRLHWAYIKLCLTVMRAVPLFLALW